MVLQTEVLGQVWYYIRAGWLGALALAQVWALAVGEKKEALLFYTPEGAVLITIFLAVFMIEGAVIGAVVDIAAYLRRRK